MPANGRWDLIRRLKVKALGARSVKFSNFHIHDSQISVPHCACPSDYLAHKKLPSSKTQEFIALFKTPFVIFWNTLKGHNQFDTT
jgi:hypothetical protein